MKRYILLLITIVVIMSSCGDENKITPKLELGDKYLGGTIYYLFEDNGEQHGLIVSPVFTANKWGCTNIALDQFTDFGQSNTEIIISECGIDNAAGYCNSNGYWLPSIEEFEFLIDSGVLPIISDYYWTSNKASYTEGYAIRLSDKNVKKYDIPINLQFVGIKEF